MNIMAPVVVLATLALCALTGCPAPITCVEAGCSSTQLCNQTSGLCEQRVRDCRVDATLCGDDEFCNQATGRCISTQQQCGRDQAQCPDNQTCDAENGVCRLVGLCRSDVDCAPGERCGLTGSCETIRCQQNEDCAEAGFVCIGERCMPGCQLPESPCPEGSFCQGSSQSAPGECVSSCAEDRDCNFGFFCDVSLSRPTCIKEDACNVDLDCRADERCQQSACQPAPCSMDEDCLSGQVCDRAQCVGSDCNEDTFSPNHMPNEATLFSQEVEISNLVRCAGRPDWFRLQLDAGEVLNVELIHEAGQDIDLYVLDGDLRPLAQNEGQRTRITLNYESSRAQDVYLLVESTNFTSSLYSLKIARSPVSTCNEDSFEENDAPDEAFRLSLREDTPLTLALQACYGDEDWFRIPEIDATQGLALEWNGAQDSSVHVDLLTPDGQIYAIARNELQRQLRVHTSGDYYVRVANEIASSQNALALTLTLQNPYTCIDLNAYNTPDTAFLLLPDMPSKLLLCPGEEVWEVDWLQLASPDAPGRGKLVVSGTYEDFELNVVLFELTEVEGITQPVALRRATRTASQRWELEFAAKPDTRYSVRVSTDAPLRRLFEPNFYDVSYIYQ